jgi:hypothetical protein
MSNSRTAPLAIRAKRKEKPASTRHADHISRTPDFTPSFVPSGAPSNDLAALKVEKATLHQMLQYCFTENTTDKSLALPTFDPWQVNIDDTRKSKKLLHRFNNLDKAVVEIVNNRKRII